MNFALYIAKRYLISKSKNNAINIMTIIASAGIIIASAALFIVLSGFGGLKEFSLAYTSFVDPDLKITPAIGKSFVVDQDQQQALKAIDGVTDFSKIIEEHIIITFDNKNVLATFKGVDANYNKLTKIDTTVAMGNWMRPDTDQVVVGWGISNNLSLGVLDFARSLKIYVPKPGTGQPSSMKSALSSLNVFNVGVFQINEELDNSYIYGNLDTARYLLNYNSNQFSALELKLDETADEAFVKAQISEVFNHEVIIKNRMELNDALYKMLNTENLAVYLIFTLVIVIALFNVIGALIMMILDKKDALITLYNLGTPIKSLKRIFLLQGSLLTLIGGCIGLGIGLILVFLQQQFDLVMLTPSLPYPVVLNPVNIVIVLLTITVLGLLASKLASSRISKELIKTA
ncbi:MAG: ABC transporter permease [Bacteroidetes bacterium MedPE-SWsnd-G2]|nr:MAG: ABC transporter permease [Bacteroidetes bacterium MedPE-SWsnd-G2]